MFQRIVDRCLESLDSLAPGHSLRAMLFKSGADGQGGQANTDAISLFVIQVALAELWSSWGVVAECILAEAGAEAAGACLAGAVSLEDGLKLAARSAQLRRADVVSREDPSALAVLAKDLATIEFQPLTGRLVTTATGKDVSVLDLADPEFWSHAPAPPNRLGEALQSLADARTTVCLELGGFEPGDSAQRTIAQSSNGSRWSWLPACADEIGSSPRILEILGELYVQQVPVDWMAFYRDCSLARVPLPTYPFQRERYWLEREPDQAARQISPTPASSNGNGAHPSSVAPPTSVTAQTNGSRRMPRGVAALRPTDRPLAAHAHVAANPDQLQKVFEDCLIRVLELPDGRRIPPDQDLLDLGMDSITALEMLFAVEKSLGRPLRMPGIAKSRTINQFIALMESCASPERAAPSVST